MRLDGKGGRWAEEGVGVHARQKPTTGLLVVTRRHRKGRREGGGRLIHTAGVTARPERSCSTFWVHFRAHALAGGDTWPRDDKGPGPRLRRPGPVSSVSTQRAPGGIRTPNLLIRSQMLYPLSYGRRCRAGDRPAQRQARLPADRVSHEIGSRGRHRPGAASLSAQRGATARPANPVLCPLTACPTRPLTRIPDLAHTTSPPGPTSPRQTARHAPQSPLLAPAPQEQGARIRSPILL